MAAWVTGPLLASLLFASDDVAQYSPHPLCNVVQPASYVISHTRSTHTSVCYESRSPHLTTWSYRGLSGEESCVEVGKDFVEDEEELFRS